MKNPHHLQGIPIQMRARGTLDEISVVETKEGNFISWISGFLIFILTFVMLGGFFFISRIKSLQTEVPQKITLEIPTQTPLDREHMTSVMIDFLNTRPEVGSVHVNRQSLGLRIDVELVSQAPEFLGKLHTYVEGIQVTVHQGVETYLSLLEISLKGTISIFILIILGAACMMITLVVRNGMSSHYPIIKTLRLIGASELYIARQFQHHLLSLIVKGSAWGTAVSCALLIAIHTLVLWKGGGGIFFSTHRFLSLSILFLIPTMMLLLSFGITRMIVLRVLGNIK